MNYDKPMSEGRGKNSVSPPFMEGLREKHQEANFERREQKTSVLVFCEIPQTLQEALPKSTDKKRAQMDEKRFTARSKAFTELIKELAKEGGEQEKKGIGNISATLARLMELHVLDQPKMIRPKDETPYICLTTRRADTAFDQKSLILQRGSDGTLYYTCSVSRLTSVYNRLPVIESSGGDFTKWIKQLFVGLDVSVEVDHSRPGGVSLEGGYPAQIEKVNVSAKLSTKEEAFELFQALELSQIFMRGMESEVKHRTEKVLNTDWKRNRAYVVEGETYLYDVVHEKALEAFKAFFETTQGKQRIPDIVDVNVLLREDSMTPIIYVQQKEEILGQAWTFHKTLELKPIPLGFSIPELHIESLELSPLPVYGQESAKRQRVQLPRDQQPSIAVPFYAAMHEPSFDRRPKLELLHALGKWFKAQAGKESKRYHAEKNLQDIEKHLTTLGIRIDELHGKTRSEQEMFLKKTYRQLSRQYHPDFHPNDPNAESKMKELTQAKRFFFDEFGLDLLPSSYEEPLDIERDDEIHNTPSETLRLVS